MDRVGFVFDFDGVISLSEPVHMQAWRDLAAEYGGKAMPERFLERGVGSTDPELAAELATFWHQNPDTATVLSKKQFYYRQRCRDESVLVPGIRKFLEVLSSRGPIGLATSASLDDITPTLESYRLTEFFQTILTIESVRRPKPDPEIYLLAARMLGLNPSSTIVFEDSPIGASAARAAGMQVIGLTTTFALEKIGPVLGSVPHYDDLESVLAIIDAAHAADRRA